MGHTTDPSLFYTERHRVRGYDVDLHKRASIPTIIQMMHDAAMEHVLKLGLSALELGPLNLGWVLVRQELRVLRQPELGETVEVRTTPCGRDRAFAYRDFELLDHQGRTCATMATTWLLMDTQSRRIAPYPDFIADWIARTEREEHLPRPAKTLPSLTEPQIEKTFRVDWYSLDFNRHLTNFYYQKWMLEALPLPVLETQRLERYCIHFNGESFLDDTLSAACQELEPGEFAHAVYKNGKEIASGWSKWLPIS